MKLNDNFDIYLANNTLGVFETIGRDLQENDSSQKRFSEWTQSTVRVKDWEVLPNGAENDLCFEIQEAIFSSNQGKRIQSRKGELLWGNGPELYTIDRSTGISIRKYTTDSNIISWLESIDYKEILSQSIEDYYYTEIVFDKIYRNRGSRIGNGDAIATVEHLSSADCLLCYRHLDSKKQPTHVMVDDWSKTDRKDAKVYPLYNPNDPYKYPVSISYIKRKSFGIKHYAIPDVYGSLPWIRRANAIPYILEALTNNTLNGIWHITSPRKYWEEKEKILREKAKAEGKEYKPKDLEDLKKSILNKITELLTGVDNTGKFWHNEKVIETLGGIQIEHNWEIKPIDRKTKEFITSQLEIAKHADFSAASGMGLHTSLANIGADGKSDSGSEQLYALQGHQKTATRVPEYHVTKLLNHIIKLKFGKEIYIGFSYEEIQRQQDITPNDRYKNVSA